VDKEADKDTEASRRNDLTMRCGKQFHKFPVHVYEVRPRKDKRGVDLISDVLPFGRLWYGDAHAVANAVGYAMRYSR
jgi:hypothetical protein